MSLGSFIGKVASAAMSGAGKALTGDWAGAAGDAISMFGSQMNTDSTNKAMMQFQSDEAQKAREFNAAEADKARQFNAQQSDLQNQFNAAEAQKARDADLAQWYREQAYNDPSNQLALMRNAGINPLSDFSAAAAATSGSPSPAASGTPASGPSASVGSSGAPSLQNPSLIGAQVRLQNAQADALEEDTRLKRDTHDISVKTAQATFEMIGVTRKHTEQDIERIKQEMAESDRRMQQINASIAQSEAYASLLKLQGKELEMKLEHYGDMLLKELEKMDVDIHLTREQAKECVSRMTLAGKQGNLLDAQTAGQIVQNGLDGLEFNFQYKNSSVLGQIRIEDGRLNNSLTSSRIKGQNYVNSHYGRREYDVTRGGIYGWYFRQQERFTDACGSIFAGSQLLNAVK